MSAEHEKEPGAALKRPRGGDGGLEGLVSAGLQLSSPDKKKRKGGAQGAPFPAPPSEYGPPPNPSAEHLIAANPFDDSYAAAAAYKPAGGGYFAGPAYPGFGDFDAFRMPPHLLPRMASQYGAPAFPLRHQPPFFGHRPAGAAFSRSPAVTFGPPDNAAGFGHQPSYSAGQALSGPGQPFRLSPGENFGHIPSQNAGPRPPSVGHLRPGPNPSFGSSLTEPNHSYLPGPNSYYNQVKGSPKLGVNKHQPPAQQHHPTLPGAEDLLSSESLDVKASGHSPAGTPEGVLPKHMENLNSAHTNGGPTKPCLPCGGSEGSSSEKGEGGGSGSKIPLHPSQPSHVLCEPVSPCRICTQEVNDNQDAILCEASCQKWFHRICTGMTESAYGLLTTEASAVWGCDTCMADKDVQLMRTREMAGPPP